MCIFDAACVVCRSGSVSGVRLSIRPSIRPSACPIDWQRWPAGLLLSAGICSRYWSVAAGVILPSLALSSKPAGCRWCCRSILVVSCREPPNEAQYWLVHTHTHTHIRLMALLLGLPMWGGTRKVKPIWILLKQETMSGSGISWAICKSAPCSRQIIMPAPHHSVFYMPDGLPAAKPSCRCSRTGWRHTCSAAVTKLFDFQLHSPFLVIISHPRTVVLAIAFTV